jgi:hypothetical protein
MRGTRADRSGAPAARRPAGAVTRRLAFSLAGLLAGALGGCAAATHGALSPPPPARPQPAAPPVTAARPTAPAPVPSLSPTRKLDAYLAARHRGDLEEARSFLAPGCVIWFDSREGPGTPLDLQGGAAEWDRELRASATHDALVVEGDHVSGLFTETNDFYTLLGIDAWKARITFWFDASGLITAELYEAMPDNPDFDAHFLPALEWATRNRPEEVKALLPGDLLVRNGDTARRWRVLLQEWRASGAKR